MENQDFHGAKKEKQLTVGLCARQFFSIASFIIFVTELNASENTHIYFYAWKGLIIDVPSRNVACCYRLAV
jgi:hypothetical protein